MLFPCYTHGFQRVFDEVCLEFSWPKKHSKIVQDVSVKQRYLFSRGDLSKQKLNEFLFKNIQAQAGTLFCVHQVYLKEDFSQLRCWLSHYKWIPALQCFWKGKHKWNDHEDMLTANLCCTRSRRLFMGGIPEILRWQT